MAIPHSIKFVASNRQGYWGVELDDSLLQLSGKAFKYLLKLALGLTHPDVPEEPGWVHKFAIEPGENHTRYFFRLRIEIMKVVNWSVFENNRDGFYRLLADPGVIEFDWEALRKFPDKDVSDWLEKVAGVAVYPEKLHSAEARKAYQREYYQAHREKAMEYQRQYNQLHKKKRARCGGSIVKFQREVVQSTFTRSDIMHADPLKATRIINGILSGKRSLVS